MHSQKMPIKQAKKFHLYYLVIMRISQFLSAEKHKHVKIIFAIWLSLFSWTKIEFTKEKRHMIGYKFLQKRITRLPCRSFNNKFLIRDTITICWNATNNDNFIKFWSSEHNHERICHGFIHSRGLTLIVGKIFDTTN